MYITNVIQVMMEKFTELAEHGGPELPTGSVRVSGSPCADDTVVSELPRSQPKGGLSLGRRAACGKADNKLLFECYFKSEPESRGYKKQLVTLWRRCGPKEDLKNVGEWRLADQVRQVKVKNWLKKLKQDEIIARVNGEQLGAENVANQQHQVELSGSVSEKEGNEDVMDGLSVDRQGEEERVEVGEHVAVSEVVRALRKLIDDWR